MKKLIHAGKNKFDLITLAWVNQMNEIALHTLRMISNNAEYKRLDHLILLK